MRGVRLQPLINVIMCDGTPRRMERRRAEALLESGQAARFISQSVYKALRLGIEVKNLDIRDDAGLKAQILKVTEDSVSRIKQRALESPEVATTDEDRPRRPKKRRSNRRREG